jgi:hypothetical protein
MSIINYHITGSDDWPGILFGTDFEPAAFLNHS